MLEICHMLLFRLHGHNKYALAALQLQAWLQAMLTRYVKNKGGPGKNIALDRKWTTKVQSIYT
jgi:hypothetical protein